jgi:hypothetical protein
MHKTFSPGGNPGKGIMQSHTRNYFGELWIEGRLEQSGGFSRTFIFSPHGLPGFLYWFLLQPFLRLGVSGLFQNNRRINGVS